ncbi:MAG: DNA mismatch repair endonuclease MutL [Gemmatimonadaceae bacterium]
MPRIAILPSHVADQIAAGEVVERPASVVKELVENALDAGATAVDVAVDDGGRQRIRVSDDGVGMTRDDALLALERHATSKIRAAADLVGIGSFGFRGEALPSICSVSEFTLETAAADGEGTRVRAAGGRVAAVEEVARRRGTTIDVSRLFFNAPARQKFLRGARSEWRGIVETLTQMALTRRDVRLTVTHDGKPALTLPPAATLGERLAGLWGGAYAQRFLEVEDVVGPIHVSGIVERPADVGTAARRLYLSVNGRAVRDTGIVRAAEAAYRSTIPAGVRPTMFLDVVLPGEDVDVNVHPAKAEVRFRDRWEVERAVERAVRRALGTFDAAAFLHGPGSRPAAGRWGGGAVVAGPVDVEVLRSGPREVEGLFAPPGERSPGRGVGDAIASALPPAPAPAPAIDDAGHLQASGDALPQPTIPPLLQLHRTYMMCEMDEGVLLIDQHSAHERVLFEKFMSTFERGDAPSQQLLFPMTLHLSPAEEEAFEANRDLLERLGFEVEGFGGHTLIVRSVPMPHPRFDAERCLRDTLASLAGDRVAGTASRHERLAATFACKAAIKAGEALTPPEMRALYQALAATTLPAHDVHGRSTIVHLSWDELDRRFGRS